MHHWCFSRRVILAMLLLASVCAAHDDPLFLADRQPRYEGPGYRASQGGDPPLVFLSFGVSLQSWLPLPEFGSATSGSDCWGYTSPSGREYALIGLSNGTGIVEVTNPGNAQLVTVRSGPTSLWRDIKVYQQYAYAVSEGGGGIQIFDLTNIDSGIVTSAGQTGAGATHNVAIDEVSGFLYRTGGGGGVVGLRIYDLADPANPVLVGQWHDRYIHDAQIVTYTEGIYAGRQIAFCFSESGAGGGAAAVDILDVTNKGSILTLSRATYSSPSFSHQGYLSPDRRYLYLDDELDEVNTGGTTLTRILDVANLSSAFEVATFTNGNTSIDHNLYTRGDVIFAANYRSGLRIFDATSPTALVEIGFFDTYSNDDAANFNGLWSNYAYFASGTIIGSDLEKGLFVWSTTMPDLIFSHPDGLPGTVNLDAGTVRVRVREMGGLLTPGTAKLHYDLGAGFVEVDLQEVSPKLFDAVFPTLTCGQTVPYYFSAQADTGITMFDPVDAPATVYQALGAPGETMQLLQEMETEEGWTVGAPGDTATTGIWERVDPIGTDNQPEDDHTPDPGVTAWVTGQGSVGGTVGENDVDGGQTTLFSPEISLFGVRSPAIGYWRWVSTSQDEDVFLVDITADGGATWVNVDAVGPVGSDAMGGWMFHEFLVEDFVATNAVVQLRFIAADVGQSSIVEVAIDDLVVSSLDCGCAAYRYGDVFPITGDGEVDIDDVLCALKGFAAIPDCPGADLFPCEGDGLIDVDDILAELESFSDVATCPDRCLNLP